MRSRSFAALFLLFLLVVSLFPLGTQVTENAAAGSLSSWTKIFHMHDGTVRTTGDTDWLNSTGPYNPPYLDYDSDGLLGVTIKKYNPSEHWRHFWVLHPVAGSPFHLNGSIEAHIWAASRDNRSLIMDVTFSDVSPSQLGDPTLWTLLGTGSVTLTGPSFSTWKVYNVTTPSIDYVIPQGNYLVMTIMRGDSVNDGLLVLYDQTVFDSTVEIPTDTFITIESVETKDDGGTARSTFSDSENVVVEANLSDLFGAYDIAGANVSVSYEGNGTLIRDWVQMSLLTTDPSTPSYWKIFSHTIAPLPGGSFTINVSAFDVQGTPAWTTCSVHIVTVDHFSVDVPSSAVAGESFSMTVTALDATNSVVTDWVGTVVLDAFQTDMTTLGSETLANGSVVFTSVDMGQMTIADQNYTAAEDIRIRASSASHTGWSSTLSVSSGPVATISLSGVDPSGINYVASGEQVVFTAKGYDIYGNTNSSWTATWSLVPDPGSTGFGSVVSNGLSITFDAESVGTGNLTCTNALTGASNTTSIVVIPGDIASIDISSPSYPLEMFEGESQMLIATAYDSFGNVVTIPASSWVWTTNTTGYVQWVGSTATFTGGFVPESGVIECRVGAVSAELVVHVYNGVYGPWLTAIPPQIKSEDSETWYLSLTGFWQDINGTNTLEWWVEGVNNSLYFVSHDPSSNALMRFYTQPNQFGDSSFVLWVIDPDGFRTFQEIVIRIIPVNDKPIFVNDPPGSLYVAFETAYTFDYSYYVLDVDNQKSELTLNSSAQGKVFFDGLLATFLFPADGGSDYFEFVTLTLMDLSASPHTTTQLVVHVTDDNPPGLIKQLEDKTIYEGDVHVFWFDLDEYFFDTDSSYLVYKYGFEHLFIENNATTHEVYVSALEEWSGTTEGVFVATDPENAFKMDTITVTVIPVNDAPAVKDIGDIHVRYEVPYYLYISQYVNDPDNALDTLTFEFNTPYVTFETPMMGAPRLKLEFPANPLGGPYAGQYSETVLMTVTDPEDASALPESFVVRVSDNYPPVIIAPNPDMIYVSFPEDTYLNGTLVLSNLVSDPDDTSLEYTISSSGHVNASVHALGVVNLTSEVNWSGTDVLDITAIDSHGAWVSLVVHVTVTEVNDAPYIKHIDDMIKRGGQRNDNYQIDSYFVDCDDSYENLTIIADPGAYVAVVGGMLYVSLPDNRDVITVTIQADDGEYLSNIVTFKVGVTKTMAERIGWPYSFPLVLLAAGVFGYFLG
ncbi:MAG: cadherin-like domain-containing protein, partial [Thermoplasmata archaeon]|nr:cadherin-like domain-containing protein [Thermoplasmata archaeon]